MANITTKIFFKIPEQYQFSINQATRTFNTKENNDENIIKNMRVNKTILPVLDKQDHGIQYIRFLKKIGLNKILANIVTFRDDLPCQHLHRHDINKYVVAKVQKGDIRILETFLRRLSLSDSENLIKDKYAFIITKKTQSYENKNEGLVNGQTLLTVLDNSGAKYVKYIYPIKLSFDEKGLLVPREAVVQVVTMNKDLKSKSREFLDIDVNQRFYATIYYKSKTFTKRDSSGIFTKTEYYTRLIRPV
jgi:hypothetical protein